MMSVRSPYIPVLAFIRVGFLSGKKPSRTTEMSPLLTASTKANLFHKRRTQFLILFSLVPSQHIQ